MAGGTGPTPHPGARLAFQPRIRKGAFFEAAWRHGCRAFSVYNRTYITGGFAAPDEEYRLVTEAAAICPVMGERQVEISGPDAAAFVQNLTPRDMGRCRPGQCRYALITAPDGGILADPIVLRLDEDRFWLSTADSDLELWARGVAVHAGMKVTIRDAGVSAVQVQGPRSPRIMAALFGDAILALGYYRMTTVAFRGCELVVTRTGWSGEFGYEIYLADAERGDALFDALLEAGRAVGAAPAAVNQARRIEAGILSWGADMTPAETPFDVGLGRLVELDGTPGFIGRAALEARRQEPPRTALVGLTVAGARLHPNEEAWPLSRDGEPVGRLTSLAYSPRLGANVALGLVAAGSAGPGTALEVLGWDGPRVATVCALPFLPRRQQGDARALMTDAGG